MNRQFIALGICMLMAVIAAALLITRSIATPVQNLMQATNEIASGKLDARVSVKASDEIGHLAKIFNHMADQIQTLVRNLEERMKQLKESSEALKFSEGNLRITLQSIADAVIATDKDGNIIRMNPAAEKLTGWKDSQAKGKELPKVFDIKDESTREPIDNLIHKTLTMHETTNLPERTILTAKNGKEYKIADSAAPIRSDTGEIVGLVLVFRDITAEHELQTRLRHSQKMDAIGQLAGGIAHDFNNMLGGIIGAAELAMLLTSKGENPDKYIEMIIETADRAAELTSKLLAFARKQPSASATVDLNTPLQDALVLIENTADKRIKIHQEISENPLPVIGDPTQLQNTFLNLMLNAVQAMPEGGDIFITSDNTHITEDYCKASTFEMQPGEYASIEIRDTGCGIAQESIDRIYEPFFTTKQNSKGTGLGLAAVLGTVQQHKGSITAYSEKGNGTSFHLLFPMTEDRAPQRELLMKETIRGSGTILIVDDERVMRATASEILENLGYDTIIADNGQKGLELFKEHIDRIDLVILDMIMPEMNGRDCFMEMQKTSKDIPIILASGFSREEELQGMKEAGLKGFLHKPYRTVELSRTVHDVLTNE